MFMKKPLLVYLNCRSLLCHNKNHYNLSLPSYHQTKLVESQKIQRSGKHC